jgi:hypothetical protein
MKVETSKIPYDIVSNSGDFFDKCLFNYSFFSHFLPQKWEFVTDYSFFQNVLFLIKKKPL